MSTNYEVARCPMADCGADLYITLTMNRPVFVDDTAADLRDPAGAHTNTWSIGCTEGHVVLLPVSHAGDSETFGQCGPHECPDGEEVCNHDDLGRLHRLTGRAS